MINCKRPLLILTLLVVQFVYGFNKCDPCCEGVANLTYQANTKAGDILSQLTGQFTSYTSFGSDACTKTGNLAFNLDVSAVLVGSDGLNACLDQINPLILEIITASPEEKLGPTSLNNLQDTGNNCSDYNGTVPVPQTCLSSLNIALPSFKALRDGLILLLNQPTGLELNTVVKNYYNETLETIVKLQQMITFTSAIPDQSSPNQALSNFYYSLGLFGTPNSLFTQLRNNLLAMNRIYNTGALNINYGNFYTVSRAWSLNRPIYTLNYRTGTVSAANSIFNCYDDFRAIYLETLLISQKFC